MPVFQLSEEMIFPHPSLADADGLLAVGGDLSPERLLLAYANGIFPWYNDDDLILWWSPNPRCVLFPEKFNVPKSLRKFLRTHSYKIRFDTNFDAVIQYCAGVERAGQTRGTWITPQMQSAYMTLHQLGYAHSVEIYDNDQLVGGLYGVALGRVFFGESMFHLVPNVSKLALVALVVQLTQWEFELIDNQQTTPLLLQFGAEEIDRDYFLELVGKAVSHEGTIGRWILTDENGIQARIQEAIFRPRQT
ncbi:MAG: leucyl/phenylalanyl-tRNA--protein transferase [Bacteroidales bacterium]